MTHAVLSQLRNIVVRKEGKRMGKAKRKAKRIIEKYWFSLGVEIEADKLGGGDATRTCNSTHAPAKEWKAGAFSGGALMRMLLIIQFVNSRYILIAHDEPRVTRMTRVAARRLF